jgi:hypothetical protein
MPWDGAGNFTRTNGVNTGDDLWEQDKNAAVKIVTSRHDDHDTDLKDGIDSCLTKNGENSPTANLPMGGYKHTGAASGTANGQYLIFDQFAWTAWNPTLTPGGSMTYTSTTVNHAEYCNVNDIVFFRLDFTGTVGGTPNNSMNFTLPVTATTDGVALTVNITDNGSIVAGSGTYAAVGSSDLYRYDSAVYTAGTVSFRVHGFYQSA